MASPEVARPSPPAVRRKRRKPHHVLGDVHEFEANLRAAERAPTPPPVEESFDLHALPSDVTAAMEVCSTSYQPLLDAYKELHRERCSLQSQHEKIQDLRAAGGDATTLPPTLTAALAATRDNRTLQAHEALEAKWATQAVDLGVRLGKQPSDLTLTRTFKYRQRREQLDHIWKSVPISERIHGPALWKITLRNAYSQFVPIGNTFSGLFVECAERPPESQAVPLEIFGKPDAFDPAKSRLAQSLSMKRGLHKQRLLKTQEEKGRSWMQGSYLQSVQKKYAKYMKKLLPHYPDTSQLAIVGASMEAVLLESANRGIALEEVLERLQMRDAPAFAAYQAALDARAAAEESAQEAQRQVSAAAAAAAALSARATAGPVLRFSCNRLHMSAALGASTTATLRVTHPGTAAVYYEWSRQAPELPFQSQPRAAERCFYMASQRGTILPGANQEFCFVFKPQRAGIFTETWYLHTQPTVSPVNGPLQVTVRGCTAIDDSHHLQRRNLDALLAAQQKQRQCAAALERVLLNLREPARKDQPLPATEQAAHDAFAASTAAEAPVFYNAAVVAALGEVFGDMHAVLCPTPDPKAKAKTLKKGEAAPEPPMPGAWDGRVDTLRSYASTMLEQDSEAAKAVEERIDAILQQALLPRAREDLVAHAMRGALLGIADRIDAAAEQAVLAASQEQPSTGADGSRASATTTGATDAAGKAGTGAVEGDKAPRDNEIYMGVLTSSVGAALLEGMDDVERRIVRLREHIGGILDAQLAGVQGTLARGECDAEKQTRLAWESFRLLRQRAYYDVPTSPAPLLAGPAASSP